METETTEGEPLPRFQRTFRKALFPTVERPYEHIYRSAYLGVDLSNELALCMNSFRIGPLPGAQRGTEPKCVSAIT
jgi:hypothetical protein